MEKEREPRIEKMLLLDENEYLFPYPDSLKNWTYGVGRLIGKRLEDLRISQYISREMLNEDIQTAKRIAMRIFGAERYNRWSEPRRAAIVCLIFNMGEGNSQRGFLSFKHTIEAIMREDWVKVGQNLKLSLWARQVDPKQREGLGRDDRLANTLIKGEYDPNYRI